MCFICSFTKQVQLKPREAKLSSRNHNGIKLRQEHFLFLHRQRKSDTKAVETAKNQEMLAQEQFDNKHCRDNPRSKYKENFQAYIKEHNGLPYPALDADARWAKEKHCPVCALDMQGRKFGFGSWYNRQYEDYVHL